NGRPVSGAALSSGDRITVGATELAIHVVPASATELDLRAADPTPTHAEPSAAPSPNPDGQARQQELAERARQLDQRQHELAEQLQELDADRGLWYRRRDQIEPEVRPQSAP